MPKVSKLSNSVIDTYLDNFPDARDAATYIAERQKRLESGEATLRALKSAIEDIASSAPEDHDTVILHDNLTVLKVRYIEPHTFLFEGLDQDGQHARIVLHFTQVKVHIVHLKKRGPERIITGFAINDE